jgi:hypothetical protein
MGKLPLICAAALMIGASASAQADLVDFEGLAQGSTFNPLTINGVTFFTPNGFNVIAGFDSKALCPSVTSADPSDCSMSLDVLFGQKVTALSFGFIANNNVTIGADIGEIAVFGGLSGSALLGTVNLVVQDNSGFSLDTVDLSSFSQVTRLVITPDDIGGLLYDNFSFQADVPEPATWAMMITGFGLTGSAARRRARPAKA